MKKCFSLLLFFLLNELAFAQVISGKVVDSQSGLAIPFVNIEILHKNIGTVCDANGDFSLNISKASSDDTLKISCVGYVAFIFPLNAGTDPDAIYNLRTFELDPKSENLSLVTILPGKEKTKILGNKIQNGMVVTGFAPIDLGAEAGTVLHYNRKHPAQLKNVNFYIDRNDFDSLTFRINVYEFKNGVPGESILKEPIYITTKIAKGMLSIDLLDKNIFIQDDCFLSLEWIEKSGYFATTDITMSKLWISGGFLNSDSFARGTSQGDWHKMNIGLGFWATVKY
jgi:hypothetical protein